jgi:hypothetical protein
MSDLSITTASVGTGVAIGAMSGFAAKNTKAGLVFGAIGMGLGGLAAYTVGKANKAAPGDGSAPGVLNPRVALGGLGGGALGAMVGSMALLDVTNMSLAQKGASYGAWAAAGIAIGLLGVSLAVTDTANRAQA